MSSDTVVTMLVMGVWVFTVWISYWFGRIMGIWWASQHEAEIKKAWERKRQRDLRKDLEGL